MNEIIWLAHGGPGSGRYPKGSGKNPKGVYKTLKKSIRKDKGVFINYDKLGSKMKKSLNEDQKHRLNESEKNLNKQTEVYRKRVNRMYDKYNKRAKSTDLIERDYEIWDMIGKDRSLDAFSLKISNLHSEHSELTDSIAKEILGKYGNKKIKDKRLLGWKSPAYEVAGRSLRKY